MEGLKLQNITVNIGKSTLIESVSVSVNRGEVLSIIGPNGSGKTTLMRAISCEIDTVSGSISIDDQPLWKLNPRRRACQLAALQQFSSLSFPFTVEEVVELSRIPHSSGKHCDRQIVQNALQAMDILYLQKHLYTRLSGGEKQRVQLARVMAQIWREEDAFGTRLLLLDEPTSALDLGHQRQLMQVIRHFANRGVAIVMAVHDLNLASCCADYVLALSGGRTIAYGRPKDVIKAEVVKQLYGIDVEVVNHSNNGWPVVLSL